MGPRNRKEEKLITLEERLGPDVLKRLELMAGEFVRFERGQFGFFIDPARYAVKQRQVGPLGRGRRRKVVAGVDKDGNVITAWIGVDSKNKSTKTMAGEMVNIPDGYAEGPGGDGGGGGGGGKGKGKGGGGSGTGGGTGDGTGAGTGDGTGEGVGGGGGGGGGGGDGVGTGTGTGSGSGPGSGSGSGSGSGGAGEGGEGSGEGAGPGQGEGKGPGEGPGEGPGTGPGQDGKKNEAKPEVKDGKPTAADVAKAAAEKRQAAENAVTSGGASGAPKPDDAPKDQKKPEPPVPKPPTGALQAKNNEAKGRKKKPLHWAKVPKNLLKETIWLTFDDASVPLDEEEIDELFGIEVAAAFAVEEEEAKPEVLPHKRKHNVNILLANLKMSAEQIKDVILVPTYKDMEAASLQAILVVCPTPEEEQLLLQNLNIRDQVDRTDAFMMDLAELVGLRGKILCALAAKSFNDEAVNVIRNMDTFAMVPVEVQNSVKLNKVLEVILAMGNFLNSGTGRGGAHGFKLEALAMLSTVKDSKGDSLLDYVVRVIRDKFPNTLPMDDMPTLERSKAISLDAIAEDVQSLLDTVTNVSEQIQTMGEDAGLINFKNEMTNFEQEALKVREEIVSLRALMMDKLQNMMGHFGERNKAARGRQEDILRMLREFIDEVEIAIGKAVEKDEREQKKAAKKGGGGGASSSAGMGGSGESALPGTQVGQEVQVKEE